MAEIPKSSNETEAESGESLQLKQSQKDSSVQNEVTITGSEKQETWHDAFAQGHANDQHPSEVQGIPAVQSSFGIDFGDGQILTAKGIEEKKQEGWKPENWLRETQSKIKDTVQSAFYQDRGHEDAKMHYMEDFNAFYTTDLSKYQIDPFIIAAITRNEIEHRKAGIDDAQEEQIRKFGKILIAANPNTQSIGTQQLQIGNIHRLVNAKDSNGNWLFPQLEPIRIDPARLALNPKYGAILLGAYLQDTAMKLERGEDPIASYDKAHKDEITQTIQNLWKSGSPHNRTDALIRSYNPGDGQTHVDNVRRHLKVIDNEVGKLFL